MAKGARASTKKANNSRLKSNVFGPVENARTQRLSEKLLELASRPGPRQNKDEMVMDAEEEIIEASADIHSPDNRQTEDMELDQPIKSGTPSKSSSKGRVEKRRSSRKASIVFPKYKKGKRINKSKGKK